MITICASDLNGLNDYQKSRLLELMSWTTDPTWPVLKGTEGERIFQPLVTEAVEIINRQWEIFQTIDPPFREKVFGSNIPMNISWRGRYLNNHAWQYQRNYLKLIKATKIKAPLYQNQMNMAYLKGERSLLNLRLVEHRVNGRLKNDRAEIAL